MLNAETKRHIDAARDVLVGVAPNPMTQIDQITYALIYKFMDDMDQAAIKAGGEPSFFVGELEPYSWSKLVDARMGNQEKMNLYGEALQKFSEAKQLPELFRTIFRAAFLPYRSPETLGLFLKEINYFDYTHPEELGNAYEYLLSIMSAQGDAGQFRTPRHIIDFMVDVMNPTKDDKVLDPACGTGGFLVASYNHILEQHDGKDDPNKKEKPLTPDERKKLMANFEGYDIDPSMVRIAQVNLYLHQFKNPKIFQYDTLSSDERWGDKFDLVLANPPFMTPKGGIKPHNKFSLSSNRSEVLFIDYILNHLKPKGRAAIVVPEGIVFQSGIAYKTLRANMLSNGLYAVISLPSGVFQPYSGVKTSILVFDKSFPNESDEILFIDIKNIGLSLGAARRIISENDLPAALEVLRSFISGKSVSNASNLLTVGKDVISKNEFSLNASQYQVLNVNPSSFPFVPLKSVCSIQKGKSSSTKTESGPYPLVLTAETSKTSSTPDFSGEGVAVPLISATGHGKADVRRVHFVSGEFALANLLAFVEPTSKSVLSAKFLFHVLNGNKAGLASLMKGAANVSMKVSDLEEFTVPLPPLEVQEQIVAELDGYAAIISGAKQIVENWKPRIDVDPEWPMVELGTTCQFLNGDRSANYPTIRTQDSSGIPFINAGNLSDGKVSLERADFITEEQFAKIGGGKVDIGDVLFCLRGSLGKMAINDTISRGAIASSLIILRANRELIEPTFLYTLLASEIGQSQINGHQTGAAQPNLAASNLKQFQVPLPPLEIQKEIVERIHIEGSQIQSVKELIEAYETTTQAVIAKLWSE